MTKEEMNSKERLFALKNDLIKNDSRIIIEKVSSNHMNKVIKLAIEVFTGEQNIPQELVPIKDELSPTWWCARIGEDVVGVTASWKEENKWHWGRYAVDKRLRGIGIGKKIALFSLKEVFDFGTNEVFIEARDITLKMLEKFGCEIIGNAEEFYGEPVTPITIRKYDFESVLRKVDIN
jgi:predicted GNAT family N-acyltransferase